MTFRIRFASQVKKDLVNIPKNDIKMIKQCLEDLSTSGDPQRLVKKLKGLDIPLYSLRIGNYRVVMTIDRNIMVIFVIEIHHRKNAYRNY